MRMAFGRTILAAAFVATLFLGHAFGQALEQAPNTWVKRSPLAGTPVSPRLGYEGACVWDSRRQALIRYGGHNQGGGGEQHSEVWTYDPRTSVWTLKEPNISPPGVCCAQQNVFDSLAGRYVRFPSFSGSHGWQWWREIYLNNSTVWTYDLAGNLWRDRRPAPAPRVSPLRCAAWDSDAQLIVVFGGEGNQEGTVVYDPYTNTWTRMKPPVEPAFRSAGNMAYDARHKRHILFGAQFSDDPHTWAYDLRKNEWRDLAPPVMPTTNRNDAVLTYDAASGVVVALVKISQGEDEKETHRIETWTFDAGANRWTKMNPPVEPDPGGNRTRNLVWAPELGLTILENCTHPPHAPREQQIWTYCFARPKDEGPALPAPEGLTATTREDRVRLAWSADAPKGVEAYEIVRGTGETPWLVEYENIARVPADQPQYEDMAVKAGAIYSYRLRPVAGERSGAPSAAVRAQPALVEDVVATVRSPREVVLEWKAPDREDVRGYVIERAPVEVWTEDQLKRLKARTPPLEAPSIGAIRNIGPFVRLTEKPLDATRYADTALDLAKPRAVEGEALMDSKMYEEHLDRAGKPYRFAVYAYRVRAVNALGVESGPSPFVLTVPSAPQWLFAKEDGPRCALKWAANPERNLQGYRVYRMDGRYDSEPIRRLTEAPIGECAFVDEAAGKETRRYYVVAVDALGQEGFPSSPVWFEREWRAFYKPFVKEWHQ